MGCGAGGRSTGHLLGHAAHQVEVGGGIGGPLGDDHEGRGPGPDAERFAVEAGAGAGDGQTRRELTVKMVKTAGAVAAAPMIFSVAAPTPSMAATPAFCGQFSSGNCGSNTGCSSEVGCCCCTPPVHQPFPEGPCQDTETGNQCKSRVPTDQQLTLCLQYGHGAGSSCSAEG